MANLDATGRSWDLGTLQHPRIALVHSSVDNVFFTPSVYACVSRTPERQKGAKDEINQLELRASGVKIIELWCFEVDDDADGVSVQSPDCAQFPVQCNAMCSNLSSSTVSTSIKWQNTNIQRDPCKKVFLKAIFRLRFF